MYASLHGTRSALLDKYSEDSYLVGECTESSYIIVERDLDFDRASDKIFDSLEKLL